MGDIGKTLKVLESYILGSAVFLHSEKFMHISFEILAKEASILISHIYKSPTR
jgi:hypothetical protein